MKYVALVTLGLFCVLASYSAGWWHEKSRKPRPVVLIREVHAAPRCDDTDFLCLIAWAEEQKPAKRRKK